MEKGGADFNESLSIPLLYYQHHNGALEGIRDGARDGGKGKSEDREIERKETVEGKESAVLIIQAALQLTSCQA